MNIVKPSFIEIQDDNLFKKIEQAGRTCYKSENLITESSALDFARRIVSFVKEGDELKAGERFGLIRFGSRLDVFLPKGIEPKVVLGQISVAGETVLADLKGNQKIMEGVEC